MLMAHPEANFTSTFTNMSWQRHREARTHHVETAPHSACHQRWSLRGNPAGSEKPDSAQQPDWRPRSAGL